MRKIKIRSNDEGARGMEIDVNLSEMKVATVITTPTPVTAKTTNHLPTTPSKSGGGCCSMNILINSKNQLRRTPQEFYFESRGKSCKKLLKFNGSSNKVNVFSFPIPMVIAKGSNCLFSLYVFVWYQ